MDLGSTFSSQIESSNVEASFWLAERFISGM